MKRKTNKSFYIAGFLVLIVGIILAIGLPSQLSIYPLIAVIIGAVLTIIGMIVNYQPKR